MKKTILLFAAFLFYTCSYAAGITKPKSAQYGFIENKGQIIDQNNQPNKDVLYLYSANGLQVQLRKDGISYEMMKAASGSWPLTSGKEQQDTKDKFKEPRTDTLYIHRVDISFVNASLNASITAFEPAKDYLNYYTTGTHVSDVPVSQAGVTHVQHYKKVLYQNIYPNIDIEFILSDGKQKGAFKYNFIIHPGGNINDIQLKFDGANNTSLTEEGNIFIETTYGNIEENIPLSYQINESGVQQNVSANFVKITSNTYGLNAKYFNPKLTLVIDPVGWATYFGSGGSGIGYEQGNGIIADKWGNVFVTGPTISTSNIATSGAYKSTYTSGGDAFIAMFNSTGSQIWGTYYGGSFTEWANSIAVDTNNNIIITGYTNSSSGIATTGAYQTTFGGSWDAFIAKFDTYGAMQWATYYGGTGEDRGVGISCDRIENVIVTGYTNSSNGIASISAYQTSFAGNRDAYIVKFNSSGTRQWSTYYGGTNEDAGYDITNDSNNNIIITGYTYSIAGISSSGVHQTTQGGSNDAFVAKFNSLGARQWGTYYGGSSADVGTSIISDAYENIYITGNTASNAGIATIGSFKFTLSTGSTDAFIVKFNSLGIRQWGTYYGGTGSEWGNAIALDNSGNILITGDAHNYLTSGIATTSAYQTTFGGGTYDAFVAKLNSMGTMRLWGTYFGGSGDDKGSAIATSILGNVFITGITGSTSGIATSGAYQTTYGGGTNDVFIAAFTSTGALPVKLISFDAKAIKENEAIKVTCNWSTASELNNNNFTIERSNDLQIFEDIGTVKGAGNSEKTHYYEFVDQNPFGSAVSTVKTKTIFYRLRQTDFDGASTLSEIKTVEFENLSTEHIKLVYDKDQSVLQINSTSDQKIVIQLYSLNGSLLVTFSENIKEGYQMIPIQANVTAGFYLLKTQLGNEVQYFKVWMK